MFLLNLLLASSLAHAASFDKMIGTYQITDCKESSDHYAGNKFCNYDKLSIGVNSIATVFHFFTVNDATHAHEVTACPLDAKSNIGYEYQEITNIYASLVRSMSTGNPKYDYNTTTTITKIADQDYLLVTQSEMPGFNQHQSFVIRMTKISDIYEEMPPIPPDPNDPPD